MSGRIDTRFAKLRHIGYALWEALTPPPKAAQHPPLGRRQLAERARLP